MPLYLEQKKFTAKNMADNIDHDRLFKELISTFFVDFIALFFPSILEYLDTNSINFLDKEIFTDVTQGEKYGAIRLA